ncbi:hypothetical protein [Hafnia phage TS33]|nr:hypothetical protein [Hafnia phage TS33]
MNKPCVPSKPSADPDEDLAIDVQNNECTRKLRWQVYQLQGWITNVLE